MRPLKPPEKMKEDFLVVVKLFFIILHHPSAFFSCNFCTFSYTVLFGVPMSRVVGVGGDSVLLPPLKGYGTS